MNLKNSSYLVNISLLFEKSSSNNLISAKNSSLALINWCNEMLKHHKEYIKKYGEDMPYIKDWKWQDTEDII